MEYRFLGKTGVKVSQLCFGTMSFGGDADEETSAALYHRCREAGINFFDCANMYQRGMAEEILGRLIHDERDQVVITTKAYFPMGEGVNDRGASRRHLRLALEASLRRLQTDFVDILFIHRFDEYTDLAETLSTLNDLVRQGKVLYLGASNFAAWQVERRCPRRCTAKAFSVLQPMYNLVKRQAEWKFYPWRRPKTWRLSAARWAVC